MAPDHSRVIVQGAKLGSHDTTVETDASLSWRRFHLAKSKMNNVAEMSSLMAGFAVVATVELQINADANDNPTLLVCFAVTTALLVGSSMLTVMITTCILPQLNSISKVSSYPSPDIQRSPHDALSKFINLSWIMGNSLSFVLFTLDLILMAWIKFPSIKYPKTDPTPAVAATCVMVPALVLMIVFGVLVYRDLLKHQYTRSASELKRLENIQVIQLSHSCLSINSIASSSCNNSKVETESKEAVASVVKVEVVNEQAKS